MGHLTVDPDGPICRCGRKGCLEAFIRSESVGQRLEQLDLEAENVSTAGDAHPGASPRERLYAEIGRYLSMALAHMIHLCNPKLIVVDSPYSWSKPFRESTVEETLRKTLRFPGDHTEILFVRNEESPAAGAALAIIQDYEYCG
ncbi:ROK family protein [Paenibacillus sp. DMB20]|uniref:ROK family protein n=1 Tax=Paenibacillus sp. DMB20 TaxID=1642570 RepID=UPI00069C6206|nr:ROK family protein [Paenibacillus sp. DMB20]